MPALTREILLAFGRNKQTDLATASAAAALWRLNKINAALATVKLNTETDAQEYGKGHEFATQVFKTSWDIQGQFDKYLSAEVAAWALAFGLGHVQVATNTGVSTYTCKPADPAVDGIELPSFTVVEQMRPGANSVLDRLLVGNAVEAFNIQIASGPSRANSKITVDWIGSGKYTEPSGIVMPALTPEKLLPSASVVLTANGVDYNANKDLVSAAFGWKNNIRADTGFFPGSGFQDPSDGESGAIRGRLEFGDREVTLSFIARFVHGSTELAALKSQVTGPVELKVTHDANNSLDVTFPKVSFSAAEIADDKGLVTVQVTCTPQYDPDNGLLTAVVKCGYADICQLAA